MRTILSGLVIGLACFNLFAGVGAAQCVQVPVSSWQSQAIPSQTGLFTLNFDATPGAAPIDGVIALSPALFPGWSGLAAAVRFAPSGTIDVSNGAIDPSGTYASVDTAYGYTAGVTVPYIAGQPYHFRQTVNIPAHTYSVYVTAPGASEVRLAANYAFRPGQASAATLSALSGYADGGTIGICNVQLGLTFNQAVSLANTAWGVTAAVSSSWNAVQNPPWVGSGTVPPGNVLWYCVGQTFLAPVQITTIFGPEPDPYAGGVVSWWWGCGTSWEAAFTAARVSF